MLNSVIAQRKVPTRNGAVVNDKRSVVAIAMFSDDPVKHPKPGNCRLRTRIDWV